MVAAGVTTRVPDGAPLVLKFVPTQEVAFDDQVRVEVAPVAMDIGLAVRTAVVHAGAEHDWDEGPEQGFPPLAGAGTVQVRVWVPVVPQSAEQLLHALHPPSIGVTTHVLPFQLLPPSQFALTVS